MSVYGEGVQTYASMFDGFEGAVARFLEAPAEKEHQRSYISLFEALNWAVALDVRTKELWAPRGRDQQPGWAWRDEIPGAEALRGIRFARNAMHHDWAEVLELSGDGRAYPKEYPASYGEWIWRPLSRFPRPGRADQPGEASYVKELEGNLVRSTLVGLHGSFDFLRSVLEPHSLRA